MKFEYILFGFGVLFCLAGVAYLAIEYGNDLSNLGRIASLLLTVGLFTSLGKYFEKLGW